MITPRLKSILDIVETKTIADIGTDHAYIPIRLAEEGRITKAIACDKNEGPIKIAKENIKRYNFEKIIDTRCGDGLKPLVKNEVETIIIAGMGGKLIGNIIEDGLDIAKESELILQPMNAQYELRKRLEQLNFEIVAEYLSKEGFKVYNLLKVRYNKNLKRKNLPEIEYHIPKSLLTNELCHMLIAKKKREFEKILTGQKNSDNGDKKLIEYFEIILREISKL